MYLNVNQMYSLDGTLLFFLNIYEKILDNVTDSCFVAKVGSIL